MYCLSIYLFKYLLDKVAHRLLQYARTWAGRKGSQDTPHKSTVETIQYKSSAILRWPRNVAQAELLLSSAGYLFNALFSVIPENITMNHILPKSRFFGLHFRRRQYGSNFNHCDVIGPQSYRIRWNDAKTAITSFNWNPVCDFLYVDAGNLPLILHHVRHAD